MRRSLMLRMHDDDLTGTAKRFVSLHEGEKSMNTRRYELDYAKGIGALLVIFGHMTTYDRTIVRNVIYTFHMPMFFILAGMVFELQLQKSGRGGYTNL